MIALKEGNHAEALPKLNELLKYNIKNQEIIFGKLICLIELSQYEEAQDLCETLLANRDEKYYNYMHIYLTLLFQTNQFDMLIDQIDIELAKDDIPSFIAEQFQELYQMGYQLKSDFMSKQTEESMEELTHAIHNKNYVRQWQIVESLRKLKVSPVDKMITYLENESVHPVTKTAIFKWLQDVEIADDVHIIKFKHHLTIKPTEVESIRQHLTFKQVMAFFDELEQKNPTLLILLEQLFYRYVYVRFPMMPPSSDIKNIAKALEVVGNEYLHKEFDEQIQPEVAHYIEEIKMCEHLYLSVIEE